MALLSMRQHVTDVTHSYILFSISPLSTLLHTHFLPYSFLFSPLSAKLFAHTFLLLSLSLYPSFPISLSLPPSLYIYLSLSLLPSISRSRSLSPFFLPYLFPLFFILFKLPPSLPLSYYRRVGGEEGEDN